MIFERPPTNLNGYDPTRDGDGYSWDAEKGQRAVDFFSERCCFTSGKPAGKPFQPQPWQAKYIATLYGWVRPCGSRRYRESLLAVPRKNGKTEQGAGHVLWALCADGEARAQVYSAAYTREQSSLVFEPAAVMARRDKTLSRALKVIDSTKRITHFATGSYYQALASEAANSHGKGPHTVLFDELHTQKKRDLYDGLKSGMGARDQPLFLSTTTAGTNRETICWDVWEHARRVRDGIVCDPQFLPLIYELQEGQDWRDETTWSACNPSLGVTISLEFLREEFTRANSTPLYENTFRNLYLNEWTQQASRWFSMTDWDVGAVALPELDGEPCWCGLDMSTVRDVTAFVMAFPRGEQGMCVIPHFWIPRDTAVKKEHTDRVPYRHWAEQGLVTLTNGASVDHGQVRVDINQLRERYAIQEIAVDRWNAHQLMTELSEQDGYVVNQHGQGYASMSGPSKEFEKLIVGHQLIHGGHPVLRWMANNVAAEMDPAGNIKPTKSGSVNRIDGIVAAIMAVGRAVVSHQTTYFYDSNQLEVG